LEWDLVITMALTTGMRKSEILNTVWSDIDFKNMTIEINPKENTDYTWAWEIKDTDSRILPLTEDVINLLINFQERRPEGYPYVFLSPKRYDRIQQTRRGTSKRKKNSWSIQDANNSIINNFTEMFNEIKTLAGIKKGTFHDLRRTAITNWFYAGLEITEVMRLAGHSKYDTTLKYYLAVKDDLIDKARRAVKHRVSREMLDRCMGE
jgi:integrase